MKSNQKNALNACSYVNCAVAMTGPIANWVIGLMDPIPIALPATIGLTNGKPLKDSKMLSHKICEKCWIESGFPKHVFQQAWKYDKIYWKIHCITGLLQLPGSECPFQLEHLMETQNAE